MPSSALGTMVRIRRSAPEMENIILRADEGIGPYKGGAFNRQIPIYRFVKPHRVEHFLLTFFLWF